MIARASGWIAGERGRAGLGALLAVLACAFVLEAWSLRCRRHFSYDSMVYVDTARHVATGDGIAHSIGSAHSTRLPARLVLPEPLVSQPPAYPLLIGATRLLGLGEENGALTWAWLGYLATVLLCWRLVSDAAGSSAGALAAALVLLLPPLQEAAAAAWSETLAIAFWATAAVVLIRAETPARRAFGGLLLGMTFATRYAFWPAIPAFLLALAPWKGGFRAILRWGAPFATGALIPVLLVLGRSAALGMPLGGPRQPSETSVGANVVLALQVLLGQWAGRRHAVPQIVAAATVLVLAAFIALRARASRRSEVEVRMRRLLLSWVLLYTLALVATASIVYFDPLNPRFLLPASVGLACWVGSVIGRDLDRPRLWLSVLTITALASGSWFGWQLWVSRPRTEAEFVNGSERLSWLRDNTTPRDLIIGEMTAEVGFYLRRPSVSILAAPRYEPVTHAQLMTLVSGACKDFRNIYLELAVPGRGDDADALWGPFLGGIMRGGENPGWHREATLADGSVFRYVALCRGR